MAPTERAPAAARAEATTMASVLLLLLEAAAPLLAARPPDAAPELLPPVNLTVMATGLAQVLLRWEPNPGQAPGHGALGYQVKVHAPDDDDYETRATESRRAAELHGGFSASVRTVLWAAPPGAPTSRWVSAALEAPPGPPGTAARNLTCTTRTWASDGQHGLSLHCAWLPGEAAPPDAQYFLYYRHGARTQRCPEYRLDTLRRHVGCRDPRTSLPGRGRDLLAVLVNGSSPRAALRPLDRLFALPAIDRVNPPGNVSAEAEGHRLTLRWEKPVSAFPEHCFHYEVRLAGARTGLPQVERVRSTSFVCVTDGASSYAARVRAAVGAWCRPQGSWGEWSPPVLAGTDARRPWPGWVLMLPAAVACLALLLLALACRLCRLRARLCPPVPAPKSALRDFFTAGDCERAGPRDAAVEVVHYVQEPGLEIREETVF